jgi:hypothetical protein
MAGRQGARLKEFGTSFSRLFQKTPIALLAATDFSNPNDLSARKKIIERIGSHGSQLCCL